MIVKIAQSDAEVRQCLPAMLALRMHLTADDAFKRIQFQQINDGFMLAFVDDEPSTEPASAVIGYRILNFLHNGKTLYIDDLSTLPTARGKGYAGVLLDFVIEQARQTGCQTVSLDSGQNPARYDAHRLYLKKGFNITSHHFALTL
ncbi:MAG: GNAT family N-acetyltransferase [Spirosoma sp.]|nr:GNAT family N-acetyltransferase [Spirosoma sp.]